MRTLFILPVFTAFLFFTITEHSHSRCFSNGPDMFVCDSLPPNPDPEGVQQSGNNNGVRVDVLPDGNIDTQNFAAIRLGNGNNIVDINNARIESPDRAVLTGELDDRMVVRSSELIGDSFTIDLDFGDDHLEISDSTVTSFPGGFTVYLSVGDDTLIMDNSDISGGPNSNFVLSGADGNDDFTVRSSRIHSASSGSTARAISMSDGNDKLYIENSVMTTASNTFPVRLGADDDELTLAGFGSTIPGGIDCGEGFDTIIFALGVRENRIAEITEEIENLPTPDGSITINGFSYRYQSCELLVADLRPPEGLPIPTLSEWGLIATAGALGIFGLLAVRRRKAVI